MLVNKPSNKALLLLLLIVAAVFAYHAVPQRLTLFSLSRVEIDPTGGEIVDEKLKGAYWLVTIALDHADAYQGNKLKVIEEGQEDEFKGEKVEARKSLEIRVMPYQAFFYRGIRRENVPITKDAYQTTGGPGAQFWYNMDVHELPLMSHHHMWDEGLWKAETRFKVEVWLEGVRITPVGGKIMDTHAGETHFTVDTSYGPIVFKSLGGFTGGWEEPDEGSLLIWNENYIFDYDRAIAKIRYDSGGHLVDWKATDPKVQRLTDHDGPYSVYWYGEYRWSEKAHITSDPEVRRTPAGVREDPGNPSVLFLIDYENYGGWLKAEAPIGYGKRVPVKPVIFPDQKASLPSENRIFDSVTEWLENKAGIPNRGRAGDRLDRVFRGYDSWEVDLDEKQVRVYLPWAAYEIPVIHVLVPTELVDTWVWKPPVADLKIVDCGWLSASGTHVEIPPESSRVFWVIVKQEASVEATGRVEAATSIPGKASVSPSFEEPTLAPAKTAKLYFEVTNKGVLSDTGGKVEIACKELLTGTTTDFSDGLTFTLKKGGGGGDTILDVITVDDESGDFVAGIHIFVSAGGEVREAITDGYGFCTFNLGAYEGRATISTGETETYRKATRNVELRSGTQEKFIRLIKHEEEPLPWEYIIAGAGVAVAAAAVAYSYRGSKGKRGGKRKRAKR